MFRCLALSLLLCAGLAQGADLQDPMRPPGAQALRGTGSASKGPLRWHLQSTLVSQGQRSAVINGRVVAEGSRINGARVLKISPSTVRLRGEKGDFLIYQTLSPIKQ